MEKKKEKGRNREREKVCVCVCVFGSYPFDSISDRKFIFSLRKAEVWKKAITLLCGMDGMGG